MLFRSKIFFNIPKDLKIYNCIIFHNSISFDPGYLEGILEYCSYKMQNKQYVKILFKQDETFRLNYFIRIINKYAIDHIFSVAPTRKSTRLLYNKVDNAKISNVLTGYVSDMLKTISIDCNSKQRPIDICYRGMKLPYWFGKLGYEKYHIGEVFKEVCWKYNLEEDISSDMKDRIYGKKWFEFLLNSKAVLAVESGSSIIDFDGDIIKKVKRLLRYNKSISFNEIYNKILYKYEDKINYRAISPRLFEAGATRTVLIMMEGEYQNIFKKDIHYIPIKQDYSNISEVMRKFKNIEFRKFLTDNVYKDIIVNDQYHYNYFSECIYGKVVNLLRYMS